MRDDLRVASPATLAWQAGRATTPGGKDQWIPAHHLVVIDRAICDLVARKIPERILCIEAPPRHGKSELVSRHTPAWFIGSNPDKRVMLASYSDKFARKWGRAARDLLRQIGPSYFNVRISSDVNAASEWDLAGHRGGMVTAGIGGTFTGLGADLLVIDDPIKNASEAISDTVRQNHWEWWQSTAWTRVEPGGVAIVMMTRWHEDDLIGRLIKWGEEQPEVGVARISFPAIAGLDDSLGREPGEALWPVRWPLSELEARRTMENSGYWWEALYQQNPGTYGKNEWPDSYFTDIWAGDDEWPDTFEASVIAWDPSKGKNARKGDYSALVFLGLARGLIWVDAMIQRESPYEVATKLANWANACNADKVGVEANVFQELLAKVIDDVCNDCVIPPLPICLITNTVNKELRISRLGGYLARHKFRLRKTTGSRLLLDQIRGFPFAQHNDGPDAMEQGLRLLRHAVLKEEIPEEIMRV